MREFRMSNAYLERSRPFEIYVSQISKFKTLTHEEEYELGIRKENGEQEAFDLLIQHNLRFVVSVAKKYTSIKGSFSLMDLIAEGNKGLMRAVKKYDPTKGFKLISYAIWYIRVAIWEFIQKKGKAVHYPQSVRKAINTSKNKASMQSQIDGIEISAYDVMLEDYPEFAAWIEDCVVPMENGSEEDSFGLLDTLPDGNVDSPDTNVLSGSLAEAIKIAMTDFTQIQKDVINYTYGLEGEILTLQEIGELYCRTTNSIGETKRRTLRMLKQNELLKEFYYEI